LCNEKSSANEKHHKTMPFYDEYKTVYKSMMKSFQPWQRRGYGTTCSNVHTSQNKFKGDLK
jgi:hypothetical protein